MSCGRTSNWTSTGPDPASPLLSGPVRIAKGLEGFPNPVEGVGRNCRRRIVGGPDAKTPVIQGEETGAWFLLDRDEFQSADFSELNWVLSFASSFSARAI